MKYWDWLPAFRWGDQAQDVETHGRGLFTPKIFLEALSSLVTWAAGWLWTLMLWAVRTGLSVDWLTNAGWRVDQGAAALHPVVMSSILGFIALGGALYLMLKLLRTGNRSEVFKRGMISLACLAMLSGVLISSARGADDWEEYEAELAAWEARQGEGQTVYARDQYGSPLYYARSQEPEPSIPDPRPLSARWLLEKPAELVTDLGTAIGQTVRLAESSDGLEALANEEEIADSAFDCEHYIAELNRRADEVARADGDLSVGTANIARAMSDLWVNANYQTAAAAQFGSSPISSKVYCRYLEATSDISPSEQLSVTVDAAAGKDCDLQYIKTGVRTITDEYGNTVEEEDVYEWESPANLDPESLDGYYGFTPSQAMANLERRSENSTAPFSSEGKTGCFEPRDAGLGKWAHRILMGESRFGSQGTSAERTEFKTGLDYLADDMDLCGDGSFDNRHGEEDRTGAGGEEKPEEGELVPVWLSTTGDQLEACSRLAHFLRTITLEIYSNSSGTEKIEVEVPDPDNPGETITVDSISDPGTWEESDEDCYNCGDLKRGAGEGTYHIWTPGESWHDDESGWSAMAYYICGATQDIIEDTSLLVDASKDGASFEVKAAGAVIGGRIGLAAGSAIGPVGTVVGGVVGAAAGAAIADSIVKAFAAEVDLYANWDGSNNPAFPSQHTHFRDGQFWDCIRAMAAAVGTAKISDGTPSSTTRCEVSHVVSAWDTGLGDRSECLRALADAVGEPSCSDNKLSRAGVDGEGADLLYSCMSAVEDSVEGKNTELEVCSDVHAREYSNFGGGDDDTARCMGYVGDLVSGAFNNTAPDVDGICTPYLCDIEPSGGPEGMDKLDDRVFKSSFLLRDRHELKWDGYNGNENVNPDWSGLSTLGLVQGVRYVLEGFNMSEDNYVELHRLFVSLVVSGVMPDPAKMTELARDGGVPAPWFTDNMDEDLMLRINNILNGNESRYRPRSLANLGDNKDNVVFGSDVGATEFRFSETLDDGFKRGSAEQPDPIYTPLLPQLFKDPINYSHAVRLANFWAICAPTRPDESSLPRGQNYQEWRNESGGQDLTNHYWDVREGFREVIPHEVSQSRSTKTFDEFDNTTLQRHFNQPWGHVCAAVWSGTAADRGVRTYFCDSGPVSGVCNWVRSGLSIAFGIGRDEFVANDITNVRPLGSGAFELTPDQVSFGQVSRIGTDGNEAAVAVAAETWMEEANESRHGAFERLTASMVSMFVAIAMFALMGVISLLLLGTQVALLVGFAVLPLMLLLGAVPSERTTGTLKGYFGLLFLSMIGKAFVALLLSAAVLVVWFTTVMSFTLLGGAFGFRWAYLITTILACVLMMYMAKRLWKAMREVMNTSGVGSAGKFAAKVTGAAWLGRQVVDKGRRVGRYALDWGKYGTKEGFKSSGRAIGAHIGSGVRTLSASRSRKGALPEGSSSAKSGTSTGSAPPSRPTSRRPANETGSGNGTPPSRRNPPAPPPRRQPTETETEPDV